MLKGELTFFFDSCVFFSLPTQWTNILMFSEVPDGSFGCRKFAKRGQTAMTKISDRDGRINNMKSPVGDIGIRMDVSPLSGGRTMSKNVNSPLSGSRCILSVLLR